MKRAILTVTSNTHSTSNLNIIIDIDLASWLCVDERTKRQVKSALCGHLDCDCDDVPKGFLDAGHGNWIVNMDMVEKCEV
jgi:hypothetical protein